MNGINNTFEWGTIQPIISMEVYIYLGIHSNSNPLLGYFPIMGGNNAISLIDPKKTSSTSGLHGFRCFLIGR